MMERGVRVHLVAWNWLVLGIQGRGGLLLVYLLAAA